MLLQHVLDLVRVERGAAEERRRRSAQVVRARLQRQVDDAAAGAAVGGVGARRVHLELFDGVHRRRVVHPPVPAFDAPSIRNSLLPVRLPWIVTLPLTSHARVPEKPVAPNVCLREQRAGRELQQHVDLPAVERQLRHLLVVHRLRQYATGWFRCRSVAALTVTVSSSAPSRLHRDDGGGFRRMEHEALADERLEAREGRGQSCTAPGVSSCTRIRATRIGDRLGRRRWCRC